MKYILATMLAFSGMALAKSKFKHSTKRAVASESEHVPSCLDTLKKDAPKFFMPNVLIDTVQETLVVSTNLQVVTSVPKKQVVITLKNGNVQSSAKKNYSTELAQLIKSYSGNPELHHEIEQLREQETAAREDVSAKDAAASKSSELNKVKKKIKTIRAQMDSEKQNFVNWITKCARESEPNEQVRAAAQAKLKGAKVTDSAEGEE